MNLIHESSIVLWTFQCTFKNKKESSSQSIAIINSSNGDIGMNYQKKKKKGDNLQYMDLRI